jgi:hypothetical protein
MQLGEQRDCRSAGRQHRPSGPVIADNEGRIVWYHEVPHGLEATEFRTQTYKGKPVLTWWQGTISKAGVGRGGYVVYDDTYHQLARLKAAHGLDGDLHEFQLTPRGTAYVIVYHEAPGRPHLGRRPAYVAVRALDADGHTLGDSATVKP